MIQDIKFALRRGGRFVPDPVWGPFSIAGQTKWHSLAPPIANYCLCFDGSMADFADKRKAAGAYLEAICYLDEMADSINEYDHYLANDIDAHYCMAAFSTRAALICNFNKLRQD